MHVNILNIQHNIYYTRYNEQGKARRQLHCESGKLLAPVDSMTFCPRGLCLCRQQDQLHSVTSQGRNRKFIWGRRVTL